MFHYQIYKFSQYSPDIEHNFVECVFAWLKLSCCCQVIPLDVTPAVQKQIISELEILFQVNPLYLCSWHDKIYIVL